MGTVLFYLEVLLSLSNISKKVKIFEIIMPRKRRNIADGHLVQKSFFLL